MGLGEHLQVLIFKQAGLPFIMNLFELHSPRFKLPPKLVTLVNQKLKVPHANSHLPERRTRATRPPG
jgi:hypothetical protein